MTKTEFILRQLQLGQNTAKTNAIDYDAIIVAMAVAASEIENETAEELVRTAGSEARSSLSAQFSELLSAMENARVKLFEVVEQSAAETLCNIPSTLPSIGGRPAFDIKNEHVEQLKMLV